jgi:hypothetical protein
MTAGVMRRGFCLSSCFFVAGENLCFDWGVERRARDGRAFGDGDAFQRPEVGGRQ